MFEIVERLDDGSFLTLELVDDASTLPARLNVIKRAGFPKAFIRKREAAPVPNGELDPADAFWQACERERFAMGVYRAVPWAGTSIDKPEHFAHFSLAEPGMVAFTPTNEYGRSDRRLRVKIGRYLEHWLGLSADDARPWRARFDALFLPIRFAATAAEMQRVYENGPTSCMSHPASHYDTDGIHPVTVYAAGDLEIAYMVDGERIVARAVSWPARKIRGRIYSRDGNYSNRLAAAFGELGFVSGDFQGARLRRILCDDDNYVMPYLDGIQSISDAGDCFKIDSRGDYEATNTNGLLDDNIEHCINCSCRIDYDESYGTDDGPMCEECYMEAYTHCDRCGDRTCCDDAVTVDGDDWCQRCANHLATRCDHCGDCHAGGGQTVDDDETWCDDCVSGDATWCDECEAYSSGEHNHEDECEHKRAPSPRVEDERQGELAI